MSTLLPSTRIFWPGCCLSWRTAHDYAELVAGLRESARYDRRILIERGINAREIEVSVLGNDDPIASVAGEVIPSREFYDYEAKYIDETSGHQREDGYFLLDSLSGG